jgi:hypothetical protein
MNWRILGSKGLVENSVEKLSGMRMTTSLLMPAKNAALVAMLPIIILFSVACEQHPVPFGCP